MHMSLWCRRFNPRREASPLTTNGILLQKNDTCQFQSQAQASPLTTIPYEVLFANNFKFQSQAGSLSTDHRHVYLPCSALTRGFNPRREASPLTTEIKSSKVSRSSCVSIPGGKPLH